MIRNEVLDVEACVASGQVFRFQQTTVGWKGVDGNDLICAERVDTGWNISSTPDPLAWRRLFQFEVDLEDVHRNILKLEPRLAPLVTARPGLRTLRPASALETLFSFLCTPNNNMNRIVRMAGHLASHGEQIEKGHFRFPDLHCMIRLSEQGLREAGFGYRARTITQVAAELKARGDHWLESLKKVGYQSARAELCRLPGVGPKLADCVCLFGLHYSEAVPIDTHVWKYVTEWYFSNLRGQPLTLSRYEAARELLCDRFGLYAGWVQQHMFFDAFLTYRTKKV